MSSCMVWSVNKAELSLQLNVVDLGGLNLKLMAVGAWSEMDIIPISALIRLIKFLWEIKIRSILEYLLCGEEKKV